MSVSVRDPHGAALARMARRKRPGIKVHHEPARARKATLIKAPGRSDRDASAEPTAPHEFGRRSRRCPADGNWLAFNEPRWDDGPETTECPTNSRTPKSRCSVTSGNLTSKLTDDQKRDLNRLISGDYVQATESRTGSALTLTTKGLDFLSKRGAGLNEA